MITIGYHESRYNEAPFARQVAEAYRTRHHEILVQPKDLFDLIPEVPTYFDQPFADPTLLPTLLLCRSAKEKVSVAFSGDGADELFFGYDYHTALLRLPRLFRSLTLPRKALCALAEQALQVFPNHWFKSRKLQQARKLVQILQFGSEAELFQYFIGMIGPLRTDRISALLADPVPHKPAFFGDLISSIRQQPWHDRILSTFIRTFLLDTVLAKSDRSGMAFGLELRVPFLDDELVEFSENLPLNWKFRGETKKYLLRRLLEKKLPGSLSQRPKQGFSIPIAEWLRGDLKYLLDLYLNSSKIRSEGIFNPVGIRRLVAGHLSGAENHSHLLWSLISFQLWKELYLP